MVISLSFESLLGLAGCPIEGSAIQIPVVEFHFLPVDKLDWNEISVSLNSIWFLKEVQCPHCFMCWGRKAFEYLHQSCYLLFIQCANKYSIDTEQKSKSLCVLKLKTAFFFFFPAGDLWPALNQATVDSPSSVLPPPPLASPIPAPWFPGSATTAEKQMDVMAGPSPVAADCNTAYSTGNCAKKTLPQKTFYR